MVAEPKTSPGLLRGLQVVGLPGVLVADFNRLPAKHTTRLRALSRGIHTSTYTDTYTWTSKMAKLMDPILPILSILGYWSIILGSFGGPGTTILN